MTTFTVPLTTYLLVNKDIRPDLNLIVTPEIGRSLVIRNCILKKLIYRFNNEDQSVDGVIGYDNVGNKVMATYVDTRVEMDVRLLKDYSIL